MKHHKGISISIVTLFLENLVQSRVCSTMTDYPWIASSCYFDTLRNAPRKDGVLVRYTNSMNGYMHSSAYFSAFLNFGKIEK